MNARDVKGKCIRKVVHCRFYNSHLKRWEYDLHALELSDGSRIVFQAVETQEMPSVSADYVKRDEAKS